MRLQTRMDIYPSAELRRQIDRWRASQDDPPPRAEAARVLIELGLKASATEPDDSPAKSKSKPAMTAKPPASKVRLGALMSSLAGTDASKVRAA